MIFSQTRLSKAIALSSLGAVALGMTLPSSFALAQDSTEVDKEPAQVEEILVTATKTEEKALSDVPLSISAFSGEQLVDAGILDLVDAVQFVPSLNEGISTTSRANKNFSIRGLNNNGSLPQGVIGYYIGEGAFVPGPTAPVSRLYDIDRVEVLRGPQSTLYGNGAMGGVIRFIPNAPNLTEMEGNLVSGWSETEDGSPNYHLYGAISIPLVEDKAALRLAGGRETYGGFGDSIDLATGQVTEDTDDVRITSFRAGLALRPTDRLGIDLTYQFNESNSGANAVFQPFAPDLLVSGPDDFSDSEYDFYSGTITYDFDFATLTSTNTYVEQEDQVFQDILFVGLASLTSEVGDEIEFFASETRLASNGEGPVNWVGGLYYTDEERSNTTEGVAELFLAGIGLDSVGQESSSRQTIALFGEISIDLMEGKLVPLVGLRYFEEELDVNISSTTITTLTSLTPPLTLPPTVLDIAFPTADFDSVNPRFNLAYYPDDDSTYFVNIAKGFRGGSTNSPVGCDLSPLCQLTVPSDEIWSYELGTKQSLIDGQLFVDLTVYYSDWEGVREVVNTGASSFVVAVGDAEIYGVDIALNYQPEAVPGLSIGFIANWNDSTFSSVDPQVELITGASEGERISWVPEYTTTVNVDYRTDVGDKGWSMHFNGSWNYIDEMRGGFGATGLAGIPPGSLPFGESRNLVRARAGLHNEKFSLYLVGNNLTNEDAPVTFGLASLTRDYARTVGVEFNVDF